MKHRGESGPGPSPRSGLGAHKRALTIFLALGSFVASCGPAFAAAPPSSPPGPHTYGIVIKLSGDEYSDAQNNVLEDRETRCSPAHNIAVPAGACWTWTAKHLGHGTYATTEPRFEGVHLVWTFTYTDSRGETLTGNVVEGYVPDPSRSDAITHANRYPETYEFTGGTGRFSGVTGVLTGTRTTLIVSVDPATGVAHSQFSGRSVGRLTFQSKL
jgi:hypothetical protein